VWLTPTFGHSSLPWCGDLIWDSRSWPYHHQLPNLSGLPFACCKMRVWKRQPLQPIPFLKCSILWLPLIGAVEQYSLQLRKLTGEPEGLGSSNGSVVFLLWA
jgi:hypothetical protein